MNDTVIIIPARKASSGLKDKVLLPIGDASLLEQVWRRAIKVPNCDVFVATDHESIVETVNGFGGNAIRTSATCPSGSDRVAQAIQTLPESYRFIINLQGDLPFINPEDCLLYTSPSPRD